MHIDDDNFLEVIRNPGGGTGWDGQDPGFRVPAFGSPTLMGYAGENPIFCHAFEDVGVQLIDRSQWLPLIRSGVGQRMRAIHARAGRKSKNQGQTPTCWMHAAVGLLEITEIAQGNRYTPLSALQAASVCTGGRMRGGYSQEAIAELVATGAATEAVAGRTFTWNPAWKDDAAKHQIIAGKFVHAKNIDEQVSLIFEGYPLIVGLDWWGHEIILDAMFENSGTPIVGFLNSWGDDWGDHGAGTLSLSKSVSSTAFAYLQSTVN